MIPPADEQIERYPNAGQAILLVMIALGLQVAVGATGFVINFMAVGSIELAQARMWQPWVLLPTLLVSGGLTLALGLRLAHEPAGRFLRVRPFPINLLPAMIASAVGLAILLSETDTCFVRLIMAITGTEEVPRDMLDLGRTPVGGALLAVVMAPVMEEYVFRGLILRGLLTHYHRWVAIGASAVAFGVVHGNLRQFFLAVNIGLLFGWWYSRTRSVGPGMIGHAVFNAVAWASAVFPNVSSAVGMHRVTEEHQGWEAIPHEPWWFVLRGIVLAAGGIWGFHQLAPFVAPDSLPPFLPPGTDEPPLLAGEASRLDSLPAVEPPPLTPQ